MILKVEKKKKLLSKDFCKILGAKKALLDLEEREIKKNAKKKVKDDILKNVINLFKQEKESKPKTKKEVKGDVFLDIKLVYKLRREEVVLSLTVLIYFILNVIE